MLVYVCLELVDRRRMSCPTQRVVCWYLTDMHKKQIPLQYFQWDECHCSRHVDYLEDTWT